MRKQLNRKAGKGFVIAAATAALGTIAGTASAATVTWNNATPPGVWSAAGNWTGGTGVPTSADTVVFGATGASTSQSTLTNEVDSSFTIAALQYIAQSDASPAQFHTTQIDSGQTLSVTGSNTSVHVGSLTNAATTYSNYSTLTGGGTFNINNTGATVQIRQGSSGASFTGRATLDMAGLANFTANVSNFRIGAGEGSATTFNRATGTAIFGTNNTVTAANFTVEVDVTLIEPL